MRVKKLLTFFYNPAGILQACLHPMSGILLEREKSLPSFQNLLAQKVADFCRANTRTTGASSSGSVRKGTFGNQAPPA